MASMTIRATDEKLKSRPLVLYGIRLLPQEKRRDGLWDAALDIFDPDLAGQMLPFDNLATEQAR